MDWVGLTHPKMAPTIINKFKAIINKELFIYSYYIKDIIIIIRLKIYITIKII